MEQLGLTGLCIPDARFHSPCLEVVVVAAGRYFPILLLSGQPDFKIVGFGRPEADVAGAQDDDPIRERQALQDLFRVRGQFFVRALGIVRRSEVHEFDLLELMLPDHAASILAVRARFRSETRRVRRQLHGELIRLEDPVPAEVGHRNLRRRNQVEGSFIRGLELILFELRQL